MQKSAAAIDSRMVIHFVHWEKNKAAWKMISLLVDAVGHPDKDD